MTDNEKRAHDLAIATLSYSIQPEMLRRLASATGASELNIDVFGVYISSYRAFLEAFQQEFPCE